MRRRLGHAAAQQRAGVDALWRIAESGNHPPAGVQGHDQVRLFRQQALQAVLGGLALGLAPRGAPARHQEPRGQADAGGRDADEAGPEGEGVTGGRRRPAGQTRQGGHGRRHQRQGRALGQQAGAAEHRRGRRRGQAPDRQRSREAAGQQARGHAAAAPQPQQHRPPAGAVAPLQGQAGDPGRRADQEGQGRGPGRPAKAGQQEGQAHQHRAGPGAMPDQDVAKLPGRPWPAVVMKSAFVGHGWIRPASPSGTLTS